MASRRNSSNGTKEERSKREARAERILDAASELVLRWGYKKTTIDDIAKQAGVAKGTIYLHWKTREELFLALLTREYISIAEKFREHLLQHPDDCTLHGLTKQALLLSMTHPLVKATIIGDSDILGELAHLEYADPTSISRRRIAFANMYLELMRSKGMVRTDMSIRQQVHMLMAIAMGFFMIDSYLPEEYQLSVEESADALAETVRAALEPTKPVPPDRLQEVHTFFIQMFDQLIAAAKKQTQKESEA